MIFFHRYKTLYFSFFLFLWIFSSHTVFADGGLDTSFSLGAQGGVNAIVRSVKEQADGKFMLFGDFTSHNGATKRYITRVNADGTADETFDQYGANNSIQFAEMQADDKFIVGGNFTTYNNVSRSRIARINGDGSLDTSFDPGTGADSAVYAAAIQPDGKYVIGGAFTTFNNSVALGMNTVYITRLNVDGSLDTSFNVGAGFGVGASYSVNAIYIQPDGKILAVGNFLSFDGASRARIVRLNANGSLDTSFNPGTGSNGWVYSIALQSDGKIVAGGNFTTFNGITQNNIVRLNTDGSLDASFGTGTGFDNYIKHVIVNVDDSILTAGIYASFNGTTRNRVARLNANGTLDTTFDPGGGANDFVNYMWLQMDGKIVIGGNFTEFAGMPRSYIARIGSNGILDASFDTGSGARGDIWSSVIQSDGKNVVVGDFVSIGGTSRNRIARLNADGTLDTSFNPGTGANSTINSAVLQPDGKILIAGSFTNYNGTTRNRVARVNADGTLDTSFNPGVGANNTVFGTTVLSDGKIMVYGSFGAYNNGGTSGIVRVNSDGSLDASFTGGTAGAVRSVIVQSDNKMILTGAMIRYRGTTVGYIVRVNVDGTLDTSFATGTGFNSAAYASQIQPDGKILVGGTFGSYNGTASTRVIRLNTDGTVDGSFNVGTGANSAVQSMILLSTGKIAIFGNFTIYNGTSRNRIARINSDGSLDNAFTPGIGADKVIYTAAQQQSDGKFIIGGDFDTVDVYSRNRIARLNSDGTVDIGFNASAGASDTIYTTAVQTNGSTIIGGSFTTISGANRNYIARIYASGTLDPTFDPGAGANDIVRAIAIQANGRILVGGNFTTMNGTARGRIARLYADGTHDTTYQPTNVGANDTIRAIALQSTGNSIVVGDFTTYNSATRNRLTRLGNAGGNEVTFIPGTGANNSIHTVTVLSDDSFLIGGDFTAYNGDTHNRMAKLNADGTLVTSFTPDINGIVRTIKLQQDNKILIGGDFTTVNGTTRNRIARLNTDGSLDTSFDPGTGMNGSVNSITLQNDNKIIAAGDFTTVNGSTINRITRFTTTGSIDPLFTPGTGTNNTIYTTNLHTPSTLFIGGSFITYNSTSSPYLARILLLVNPSVTTNAATNIAATTLTLNADLTNAGGEANTRVIEWGTTTGNYTSSCTAGSGIEGTYACNVTSLTPYTLYYFRAKSTNSIATVYGTELQVRTRANLATVTTSAATSIITSAATARANITNTGGNDPQRYIEWGTAPGTYTQTCDLGVGTTGNFECALTNLTPNTTYYYRAKTINDGGTSYGSEVSFVTTTATQQAKTTVTGDMVIQGDVQFEN